MATIISWDGKPFIGSMIDFGGHQWQILDIKDGSALIISEQIIVQSPYHSRYDDITWAKCSLRSYLNGKYYNNNFSVKEKTRIIETRNSNPSNSWYGTDGGAETIDKIFLLNLDEVVKYFGDSDDLKNNKRKVIDFSKSTSFEDRRIIRESPDGFYLSDKYNQVRMAITADGKEGFWWLRSPGFHPTSAVLVFSTGDISVNGLHVTHKDGGVRPAMWVKI